MIKEAFNRAGAKPEGPSGIDFLDAVVSERPDLKKEDFRFPSQGQKGYVAINGDEVFKAPRALKGECRDDFETECEVMQQLADSGLPIPKITTLGKNFLFFSMTRTPGETMGYDFESTMTETEERQLAKDLIDFVVKMAHALPMKNGKFAIHDDLWQSNIFIDPETKRLSGVIDFGKVKYIKASEWKPMYDFDGTNFKKMLQVEYNARKGDLPGAGEEKPKFHVPNLKSLFGT